MGKEKRKRRYKIWGEFPARKEPQYLFAKSKEKLVKSFSSYARSKIRKGLIKVKYDGMVDW